MNLSSSMKSKKLNQKETRKNDLILFILCKTEISFFFQNFDFLDGEPEVSIVSGSI